MLTVTGKKKKKGSGKDIEHLRLSGVLPESEQGRQKRCSRTTGMMLVN